MAGPLQNGVSWGSMESFCFNLCFHSLAWVNWRLLPSPPHFFLLNINIFFLLNIIPAWWNLHLELNQQGQRWAGHLRAGGFFLSEAWSLGLETSLSWGCFAILGACFNGNIIVKQLCVYFVYRKDKISIYMQTWTNKEFQNPAISLLWEGEPGLLCNQKHLKAGDFLGLNSI